MVKMAIEIQCLKRSFLYRGYFLAEKHECGQAAAPAMPLLWLTSRRRVERNKGTLRIEESSNPGFPTHAAVISRETHNQRQRANLKTSAWK